MDEKDKKQYLEKYRAIKEKGVPFFPDILVKDAIAAFAVFLLLIGLSYFLGAPLEEQADPSDSSYLPRPEWYFRFLFQLLKYFPGSLEVIGVVVIPTLVVLFLIVLPFIDRSPYRHIGKRIPILVGTALASVGVIALTLFSYLEAPPPEELSNGDPTALLYSFNCAGCHGASSNVPSTADLHGVISQGNHEGMPPWSGDLTDEEIDSLAGFILSPTGSETFSQNCGDCHEVTSLVFSDPALLRQVLDFSASQENHVGADVPFVNDPLSIEQRSSLINFLIAPDGKRLFTIYCSSCHGSSVSTPDGEETLRQIIIEGGQHRDMPAWGDRLDTDRLEELANYIINPVSTSSGAALFQEKCTSCHFENVPMAESFDEALTSISIGGAHETMPEWGQVLEDEQLDALVSYAFLSASDSLANRGLSLYIENCAACHGEFGEGGPNPSQAGDVIAPISTAEYLRTRDDYTLNEVINRGQPNFGMSPFGLEFGGPLDSSDIDLLVEFIRAWEADPPVEFPPEIQVRNVNLSGAEVYQSICSQCHGEDASGDIGPSLRSSFFRQNNTSEDIFSGINVGHRATSMIAWGEILNADQVQQLVDFITSLPIVEGQGTGEVSFAALVGPTLKRYCAACHDNTFAEADWNATTYEKVMTSGFHSPVVVPEDVDESLLAQMILGNLGEDQLMPPSGNISEDAVRIIIEWIENGAKDN